MSNANGMNKVEVTNAPTLITVEGHFNQNAYTIEQWVSILSQLQKYIEGIQEQVGETQERIASFSAYSNRIKDAIEPHLSKGDE